MEVCFRGGSVSRYLATYVSRCMDIVHATSKYVLRVSTERLCNVYRRAESGVSTEYSSSDDGTAAR